jgi:hypothetical protein
MLVGADFNLLRDRVRSLRRERGTSDHRMVRLPRSRSFRVAIVQWTAVANSTPCANWNLSYVQQKAAAHRARYVAHLPGLITLGEGARALGNSHYDNHLHAARAGRSQPSRRDLVQPFSGVSPDFDVHVMAGRRIKQWAGPDGRVRSGPTWVGVAAGV